MSSLIHALRAHRVCVEGNGEARGSEKINKGGGRRGRKGEGGDGSKPRGKSMDSFPSSHA